MLSIKPAFHNKIIIPFVFKELRIVIELFLQRENSFEVSRAIILLISFKQHIKIFRREFLEAIRFIQITKIFQEFRLNIRFLCCTWNSSLDIFIEFPLIKRLQPYQIERITNQTVLDFPVKRRRTRQRWSHINF